MQKYKLLSLLGFLSLLFIVSCTSNTQQTESETVVKEEKPKEITLTPAPKSAAFADASIKLEAPLRKDKLKAGDVAFDFTVENYELGNQTADAAQKLCANSAEGQHIHLILNNQPYSAYYTADFMKELTDNYYVALAFLSRSYHESIKEKNAYVLWDFVVGDMKEVPSIDLQAPHMFYSRPKGNYVGEGNIENILLDFYLTNVSLSPDGNKVRATIDDKEFMLTSWEPYFISGLGLGEHTVKLELLDNQNQLVQSPFNPVTRKFSLFEDEPLVN